MRIVLTGGGTGGHIFPLVAVAKKIKEKRPDVQLMFIGPKGKLEEEAFAREIIPAKNILAGKMRRYFSWLHAIDFIKLPIGFVQALWLLLLYMPDAIFSKGGYASIPVVLAGWIYRIPILTHESDSIPGVANSFIGKFSKRVAVSYPEAEKEFPAEQVVLTGNPIRADITQGDAQRIKIKLGLSDSKKIIFVYGGSQGAKNINEKILDILPKLIKKYQIIHQTGEKNFEEVTRKAGELGFKAGREGYEPIAFVGDDLKDILAASDLVITRAGANSISEIAANGKPTILIPIAKSANDHQRMNAYSLARSGGAIVLEEGNLGENLLMSRIDEILENAEMNKKLSENIKKFYHADAADKIADGLIELAGGN